MGWQSICMARKNHLPARLDIERLNLLEPAWGQPVEKIFVPPTSLCNCLAISAPSSFSQ
jgi:hypothetical protein